MFIYTFFAGHGKVCWLRKFLREELLTVLTRAGRGICPLLTKGIGRVKFGKNMTSPFIFFIGQSAKTSWGEERLFRELLDEDHKILTLLLQASSRSSSRITSHSESGEPQLAMAVLAGETITQAAAVISDINVGF